MLGLSSPCQVVLLKFGGAFVLLGESRPACVLTLLRGHMQSPHPTSLKVDCASFVSLVDQLLDIDAGRKKGSFCLVKV